MSEFKFFKLEDFDCQETGENEMDVEFIKGLDHLRQTCGFPFVITSGFRGVPRAHHHINVLQIGPPKKIRESQNHVLRVAKLSTVSKYLVHQPRCRGPFSRDVSVVNAHLLC